jgi:DNA-binding Lrp family transcriptional regulator
MPASATRRKSSQVRLIELLHHVSEKPSISNSEIAEQMKLSGSSVTNLIGRAERKKLMERAGSQFLLDTDEIRSFVVMAISPLVLEAVHKHPGRGAETIFNRIEVHEFIPRDVFDQVVDELLADYSIISDLRALYPNHPKNSPVTEAALDFA